MTSTKVRIHAFEPASRANGPGLRAVVWFQGCTLGCPGCFNPGAHDPKGGSLVDIEELVQRILAHRNEIEGVTISGGEPFEQAGALLNLLERLAGSKLSRLVFTGYALQEVMALPIGPRILERVDVLVAGHYIDSLRLGRGLLGSSNQRIHLLTGRYRAEDFKHIPVREVIVHSDGTITLSGIDPLTRLRSGGDRLAK